VVLGHAMTLLEFFEMNRPGLRLCGLYRDEGRDAPCYAALVCVLSVRPRKSLMAPAIS
jgi:hypothetical protein